MFKQKPKYLYFLLLATSLLLPPRLHAQYASVDVIEAYSASQQVSKKELKEVLDEISKTKGVTFTYQVDLVESTKVFPANDISGPVSSILENLFRNTPLRFKEFAEDRIVIYRENASSSPIKDAYPNLSELATEQVHGNLHLASLPIRKLSYEGEELALSFSELVEVTGKVTDTDGVGLVGASVTIKGQPNLGTVTDLDGNFRLTVPSEDVTLVVSYTGYQSQEVLASTLPLDIQLGSNNLLDEVVVVGYGTQKKSDVTGAISSVKTEDVKRAVTTSAEELFQGRMSGVTVIQGSNAPGGGIQVRVRGTSSISGGNDPLYVVDGIPIANSDQESNNPTGLRFTSNPSTSPLSQINPNDIESIEVLKDASATAIYGARGANGVVIITTKRGVSGRAVVELATSYGLQEATRQPELLNAAQFVALNDEARQNVGRDLIFDGNVPPFDTDWQDELYRSAAVQNHSLSVRGGSDRTIYSLSFGYFDQEGVMRGTQLQRYSGRINLEQQATNWLKVGLNANISRTKQDQANSSANASVNEIVPIGPVRIGNEWFGNSDFFTEDYTFGLQQANILAEANPVRQATFNINNSTTDRTLGSLFGEISFTENLKFRTTVGADIANGRTYFFAPSTPVTVNVALNRFYNSSHLSLQNQLTYNANLNGKQRLSATIVQSVESFRQERIEALAENISDATTNFNFNGDTRIENDKFPAADIWSIASFLGRVNYDYDSRYLLTASVRYDGSSRFGSDKRWGVFPAVSAGWIISKEGFFDSDGVVSLLKLRAGWGLNGSQDIGAFRYLSLARGTRAVIGNALFPGVEPSNIANSELGWESTRQLNLGLDASFLQDRFTVSANVYDKVTSDLLFNTNVPFTSGQRSITLNVGEVRNRGFEVEVGGYVVNRNRFSWEVNANYSNNENEVLKLDGILDSTLTERASLLPGRSLGAVIGYETNGLWQEGDNIADSHMPGASPGDRRYVDLNGDGRFNGTDRRFLGSTIPVHSYGINNTFSYSGFTLNVFFQGLAGFVKFNGVMQATENVTGQQNASVRVLDRWTPTNTNTLIESARQGGRRPNVPGGAEINDYYVEDASFLRLKNVSLAYNLPGGLIERIGMSSARISVTGQNLATFTDFTITDPEAGDSENDYPLVRTFTIGLNLGF